MKNDNFNQVKFNQVIVSQIFILQFMTWISIIILITLKICKQTEKIKRKVFYELFVEVLTHFWAKISLKLNLRIKDNLKFNANNCPWNMPRRENSNALIIILLKKNFNFNYFIFSNSKFLLKFFMRYCGSDCTRLDSLRMLIFYIVKYFKK